MSSDAKTQTDKIPDETGKTYYERTIDALRLIGTGNAAGLLATGAALGAAIEKHLGSVPLLKCAAILFALGVITFPMRTTRTIKPTGFWTRSDVNWRNLRATERPSRSEKGAAFHSLLCAPRLGPCVRSYSSIWAW